MKEQQQLPEPEFHHEHQIDGGGLSEQEGLDNAEQIRLRTERMQVLSIPADPLNETFRATRFANALERVQKL